MGYALLREVEDASCAPNAVREVAGAHYGPDAVREVAGIPYRAGAAGPAQPLAPWEIDPDAAEELGDKIATLAAHIHAATHRFLVLIARFDRMQAWEAGGHRSCSCWLSFRTGLDPGTAREHVRVARALEHLPRISEAMASGELSFSKVRALTRVAEVANEADLLELARGCTTAQLERMVRAWKKGSRQDEAERERQRYRSRSLSVFPDDDGMYVVRARLMPETGALLMRAIDEAGDQLYRESRAEGAEGEETCGPECDTGQECDTQRESARRRADALGLLIERALAAGGAEAPISGARAGRYQVVLHVEPATLAAEGEPGRSELEDGTRVSAETSRRLSCDAAMIRVTHAADGSVLDVGRRTRTIPPALRRALEVRDRGCRFPGCGLRCFTDGHHVVHWGDGGETSLGNTALLCKHHHRLVHEGGWRMDWWGKGRAVFRDPRGQGHYSGAQELPELSDQPVRALVQQNRLRGVEPDPMTPSARWKRESDIPGAVLSRASEAGL